MLCFIKSVIECKRIVQGGSNKRQPIRFISRSYNPSIRFRSQKSHTSHMLSTCLYFCTTHLLLQCFQCSSGRAECIFVYMNRTNLENGCLEKSNCGLLPVLSFMTIMNGCKRFVNTDLVISVYIFFPVENKKLSNHHSLGHFIFSFVKLHDNSLK